MFCKYCGKEMNDNAAVCPHCGVPVESEQKLSPGTTAIIVILIILAVLLIVAYCGGIEMWFDVQRFFSGGHLGD